LKNNENWSTLAEVIVKIYFMRRDVLMYHYRHVFNVLDFESANSTFPGALRSICQICSWMSCK